MTAAFPDPRVEAAAHRYWTDAEFHARVVVLVDAVLGAEPDDEFVRWHRDSLLMGAALALISTEPAAAPPATPAPLTDVVEHGNGAKGIDQITEGQLVEVVLRGYARNVDHDGRQGPRLTLSARADLVAMNNAIYARDDQVVSVRPLTPEESP